MRIGSGIRVRITQGLYKSEEGRVITTRYHRDKDTYTYVISLRSGVITVTPHVEVL